MQRGFEAPRSLASDAPSLGPLEGDDLVAVVVLDRLGGEDARTLRVVLRANRVYDDEELLVAGLGVGVGLDALEREDQFGLAERTSPTTGTGCGLPGHGGGAAKHEHRPHRRGRSCPAYPQQSLIYLKLVTRVGSKKGENGEAVVTPRFWGVFPLPCLLLDRADPRAGSLVPPAACSVGTRIQGSHPGATQRPLLKNACYLKRDPILKKLTRAITRLLPRKRHTDSGVGLVAKNTGVSSACSLTTFAPHHSLPSHPILLTW